MVEILLWIWASGSVLFLLWHVYQIRNNRFHEANLIWIVAGVTLWPFLIVMFVVMALLKLLD